MNEQSLEEKVTSLEMKGWAKEGEEIVKDGETLEMEYESELAGLTAREQDGMKINTTIGWKCYQLMVKD